MNKEEIVNIYIKYKFFLFPFLIVMACILVGFFVIYPQWSRIIADQDRIAALDKKTSLLESKARKLDSLDEKDIKEKLAVALKVLPAESDFATTLGLIQNLANQYQFIIVNFQTSQSGGKENLKLTEYSISLDLIGPRDLMKKFIDSINENFRLMRTARLEINIPSSKDEVTANITVDAFFSQIPQSLGSVDAPVPEISNDDERLMTELASQQPYVAPTTVSGGPKGKTNPFD